MLEEWAADLDGKSNCWGDVRAEGRGPTGRTWSGCVQTQLLIPGTALCAALPKAVEAFRGGDRAPLLRCTERALSSTWWWWGGHPHSPHTAWSQRQPLCSVEGILLCPEFSAFVFFLAQSLHFTVILFSSLRSLKNRARFLTENLTSNIY